jgi:hypothetical protein
MEVPKFALKSRINKYRELNYDRLPKNCKVKRLSKYPYVVQIKNVITDEEIKELLKMGKAKFQRSNMLIDGELVYDEGRTSSTAYIVKDGLPDQYSRPVEKFIKRIQYLTGCKREQIEMMMVRYRTGQKFKSHVDYFTPEEIGVIDTGGQRIYTFFIYLNTLHGDQGGATEFKYLGIKSKPRKGSCLFWHNQNLKTGEMIPETEHSGNPVTAEGVVKYGLNCWIRSEPF